MLNCKHETDVLSHLAKSISLHNKIYKQEHVFHGACDLVGVTKRQKTKKETSMARKLAIRQDHPSHQIE